MNSRKRDLLKEKLSSKQKVKDIKQIEGWNLDDLIFEEAEIIDYISDIIKDSDKDIRLKSLDLLEKVEVGNQKKACQILIDVMWGDEDEDVRIKAIDTLYLLDFDWDNVVKALLKTLHNDSSYKVRRSAASILDEFQEKGKIVIPALIKSLKEETDIELLISVALSLSNYGEKTIQPLLEIICTEKNQLAVDFSLFALSNLSEKASSALDILKKEITKLENQLLESEFAFTIAQIENSLDGFGYNYLKDMEELGKLDDDDIKQLRKFEIDITLKDRIGKTSEEIGDIKNDFDSYKLKLLNIDHEDDEDLNSIIDSQMNTINKMQQTIENLQQTLDESRKDNLSNPRLTMKQIKELRETMIVKEGFWKKWGDLIITFVGIITTLTGTLLAYFLS